jgi:tetratricopeptide (TPR) repeat protein
MSRIALVLAAGLFAGTWGYSYAFQQSAANGPSDPARRQLNVGADLLQRGQFEQAIHELKKAIALDPQSAASHMLLGQAYLGMRSVGLIAEAKAELQQALDLDPNLIWARFYLAKVYIDQGRSDKAKVELERGLAEKPNVPHFLSLLGEVHRKLGNPELAIQLNQQALNADPSMTPAHYFMGLAYMDLKKQDQAIQELEKSLKSPYVAPEMYLTLGSLYAGEKRYAEGEELVKKAIALDPSRPEGHVNLATLYNLKGAGDQALHELKLALPEGKTFPTSPYYQQLQADVFFETGRAYECKRMAAEAIRAYSTALALNANEGRTHARMATLYCGSGDYERSFQHLTMAEKLGFAVDEALKQEIIRKREETKPAR